jgi:hypothetical protein
MKDLAVASASAVVPPVKNGIKPADETGNGEFLQPQFLRSVITNLTSYKFKDVFTCLFIEPLICILAF